VDLNLHQSNVKPLIQDDFWGYRFAAEFFLQRRICLTELAQESWRDLAAGFLTVTLSRSYSWTESGFAGVIETKMAEQCFVICS
jgi:hypothetical protein